MQQGLFFSFGGLVNFLLNALLRKKKFTFEIIRYRHCHVPSFCAYPTFQVNVRILPSAAEFPRLQSCALQFTHICPSCSFQNRGNTLQHRSAVTHTEYQHSPCSAYWSVRKGPLKGPQWCVAMSVSDQRENRGLAGESALWRLQELTTEEN